MQNGQRHGAVEHKKQSVQTRDQHVSVRELPTVAVAEGEAEAAAVEEVALAQQIEDKAVRFPQQRHEWGILHKNSKQLPVSGWRPWTCLPLRWGPVQVCETRAGVRWCARTAPCTCERAPGTVQDVRWHGAAKESLRGARRRSVSSGSVRTTSWPGLPLTLPYVVVWQHSAGMTLLMTIEMMILQTRRRCLLTCSRYRASFRSASSSVPHLNCCSSALQVHKESDA